MNELTSKNAADAVIREKFEDLRTPGFIAEFDALEAERAGAFTDDAMSEADALASVNDGWEPDQEGEL